MTTRHFKVFPQRPFLLFDDPFAAALADAEWLSVCGDASQAETFFLDGLIVRAIRTFGHPYLAIRTRFFDDLLLRAVRTSTVRQVVITAAGMDARAFRLPWPPDAVLYELDFHRCRPQKTSFLQAHDRPAGATPWV